MTQSTWLGAPLMSAGQSQKEWTFNEAVEHLGLAIAACVEELGVNDPPASPVVGQAYVVGDQPTGDWFGHVRAIAGFSPGGWRFVAAAEGMRVIVRSSGVEARVRGGAWETGVGPRLAAVAAPTGGTTVDAEARAAIASLIDRLVAHGLIAA